MIDYRKDVRPRDAYIEWRKYAMAMGLGIRYDSDLPFTKPGNIPSPEFYDKYYGKNHWTALTVISLAIGQGEILTTPLQLANLASMIANRGYYFTPHLVRALGTQKEKITKYGQKHESGINKSYFDVVIEGMLECVEGGTAALSKIDSIEMCGKTGTAQNPHGKNHSVFLAFSPQYNPKIAIAVFIENSGYGGTWAAPIASLMIEKYIRGYVKENRKPIEQRMLEGNLL
jgi:penicillin-binding protein 2